MQPNLNQTNPTQPKLGNVTYTKIGDVNNSGVHSYFSDNVRRSALKTIALLRTSGHFDRIRESEALLPFLDNIRIDCEFSERKHKGRLIIFKEIMRANGITDYDEPYDTTSLYSAYVELLKVDRSLLEIDYVDNVKKLVEYGCDGISASVDMIVRHNKKRLSPERRKYVNTLTIIDDVNNEPVVGALGDDPVNLTKKYEMLKAYYLVGSRAAIAYSKVWFARDFALNDLFNSGFCYLNFFNDRKKKQLLLRYDLPRYLDYDSYKAIGETVSSNDFNDRVNVTVKGSVLHVEERVDNVNAYDAMTVWQALPSFFISANPGNMQWDNNIGDFRSREFDSTNVIDRLRLMDLAVEKKLKLQHPDGNLTNAEPIVVKTIRMEIYINAHTLVSTEFEETLRLIKEKLSAMVFPSRAYNNVLRRLPIVRDSMSSRECVVDEEVWRTLSTQVPRLFQAITNHQDSLCAFKTAVEGNHNVKMITWL